MESPSPGLAPVRSVRIQPPGGAGDRSWYREPREQRERAAPWGVFGRGCRRSGVPTGVGGRGGRRPVVWTLSPAL